MIAGLAHLQTKVFGGQGRVGIPFQHLVHSWHPDDELQRDASERLTVIDTSLCPTAAGTIWRIEYVLPDLRSPLPVNFTLGTFFRAEEGYFVRAAVVPVQSATKTLRLQQDGGRLIRIDLGGRGLPFSAGDCLGWAHARNSGLAFIVDEDSILVEVMPSTISVRDVSALKSGASFHPKARTYAVKFFAKPHSDPFGCWSSIMLGTPSMQEAASLFDTRTQLHCCYNAPLQAKSSEMPACFGLVESQSFGTPGYQWYHPSHCCKEMSLEEALSASVRCKTSAAQSPWLTALSSAARCFALCCSGTYYNCLGRRLLHTRRSSVDQHRRRIHGRRMRDLRGLSAVADCPAASVVLGLLHDVSASSSVDAENMPSPTWKLYSAGSRYDSLCSLYGYDHADCCLQRACHSDSRECVACLLVEVPWGSWSLAQRRIIAHVVRRLRGAMVSQTPIPATLQSALRRLLVKDDFLSKAHASVHPKQLILLLGVLLQLVEATNGQRYLYDALHALQVGAPLELISPLVMADFIEELPEQGLHYDIKEEVCAHSWPSDRNHGSRRQHDAASFAARDFCGVAGASLKIALSSKSAGRCCPQEAWPALVRAAAEVNYWITGVFAMCVLCVVAPTWPRKRLTEAVALVDNYLDCPPGRACPWQKGPCGKAAWEPILVKLRVATTCILLPASMAPSSLLPQATNTPLQQIGPARLLNHGATMAFLQAGGSLMRMNDGEQLMMHPGFNHPLTRLTDTMIRLRFAASAACPGLCVGLLHPDDDASVRGLGETHYDWWTRRGFRLTRSLFKDGIFPANQTYCFGLPTYRPKSGPAEMSTHQFSQAWDRVFANRSVLLVSPGDGLFSMRCGNCIKISEMLYGQGHRVAPFRLARSMYTMNPGFIKFTQITGVEWGQVVTNVRMAAAMAKADTVAVSWGPYADILVSELACRGLRALDIGNLISILQGGEAAGQMDPDDVQK